LLVTADEATTRKRLKDRDNLDEAGHMARKSIQLSTGEKRMAIAELQRSDRWGRLIELENNLDTDVITQVKEAANQVLSVLDIYGKLRIPQVLKTLGFEDPESIYMEIKADHDRAETPYHCWEHIMHGLDLLWEYRDEIPNFEWVVFAWLNHDRVYDVQAKDNEAKSADLAVQMLDTIGAKAAKKQLVKEIILDTLHTDSPATSEGKWLVSIDLAIVGETPDEFQIYDDKIAREYSWVPPHAYRAGRKGVMGGFLKKIKTDGIYHVQEIRDRFHDQAIENLEGLIANL